MSPHGRGNTKQQSAEKIMSEIHVDMIIIFVKDHVIKKKSKKEKL